MKIIRLFTLPVLTIMLAACGGGGGGTESTAAAPTAPNQLPHWWHKLFISTSTLVCGRPFV